MKTAVARLTLVSISLIVISLMFVGQSPAKIDPKSIVGLWLLDEGKGDTVKDSSQNGNDGKLMNGPKWGQGKFGKAIEFDGSDDYVEIPDSVELNPENALTVMAWIKPSSFPGYSPVIDKEWAEVKRQYSFGYPSDKRMGLWFDNQAGTEDSIRATTVLVEGTWYFIAATFDSGKVQIFVNGNLENSKTSATVTSLRANDTASLCLGGEKTGRDLNGTIDEVAIFNVVLTEDDIKSIMTQGLEEAVGLTAVSSLSKLTTTWSAIKNH